MIAASYIFYGWWNPRYIVLLAGVTVVAQAAAIVVSRQEDQRRRMWAMGIGIAAVIGPLLFFKYYGFFAVNVRTAARARPAARAAVDPGGAAGGHLLLHVHGDQLRRRRLPRASSRRRRWLDFTRVPVVLPAPGGRSDRADRAS